MKKTFIISGAFLVVLPLLPTQAQAVGLVQCGAAGQPACRLCDIFVLINTIINFFLFPTQQNNGFAVVPILAMVFLTVGGVFLLVGGGNAKLLSQGRTILTATIVGLIIVYAAWLFVEFLMQSIGVASWTGLGKWWQISCQYSPP